jgi:hypothetical protein
VTTSHVAYLFDLEGFRQELNVLGPDLDREDYTSLLARANTILVKLPQIWDTLSDFHWYEDVKDYDESELCKISTLAILAQYLVQCPSIDHPTWEILIRQKPSGPVRNWQVISKGLRSVGWTERDVLLLVEGMSTDWLMRPTLVTDPLERLPPSHAWYSIGRTGWLDVPEVQRLLDKLNQSRREFLNLKPVALPFYEEGHNPISDEQIELAFVCTLGMLKTAQVAGKELLLGILP